jgi:hypothetical protein
VLVLLPPLRPAPHGTSPARKLWRLEQRALREMESGTMREAIAYDVSGSPSDPKVRMAGDVVLAGMPTGAKSGSIPTSPLTVRYGGTSLRLTSVPTGAVEDTSDIGHQGYETAGWGKGSYPLEVVPSPPSDRLSAVDSQVSVAPSTAFVAVLKRPRLDDSRIVASDSPTGLPLADAAPQPHQPGLHADQLALPLADTEPREIPWEGLMPPPQVQAEDTRSRTSRGFWPQPDLTRIGYLCCVQREIPRPTGRNAGAARSGTRSLQASRSRAVPTASSRSCLAASLRT